MEGDSRSPEALKESLLEPLLEPLGRAMAEEEDRPSSGFAILAPARKLAVRSGQFKFSTKIFGGNGRWSVRAAWV